MIYTDLNLRGKKVLLVSRSNTFTYHNLKITEKTSYHNHVSYNQSKSLTCLFLSSLGVSKFKQNNLVFINY